MKSKIYYDITKSPFFTDYENFKLYFSSANNLRKFKLQIDDYINEQAFYISNRYEHINCVFNELFILAFYKRLEKRGFKVIYKGNIELKADCVFDTVIKDADFLDYYEREEL